MSGFYDGPITHKIGCCLCGSAIWEPTEATPVEYSWKIIKHWHFPSPYNKAPVCSKCFEAQRLLRAKERPALLKTQLKLITKNS